MENTHLTEKNFDKIIQNIFLDYFNNKSELKAKNLSITLLKAFNEGLTWHEFSEISIPTKKEQFNSNEFKKIEEVDIFLLKELISPIFKEFFIKNLTEKQYKYIQRNTYRKLGNKAFAHDFFDDITLKSFWNFFDYSNNSKYRNEFLINVSSYAQLNQLNTVLNIDPLTIITKENNIETFLLTNAFQREIFSPPYWCRKTNDFTKLQEDFIRLTKNISINDMQTEHTSHLDLMTRIAFAFSYMKDESKYNKFLNSIGITEVNLNCSDYWFNKKNIISFKDKLIETSKIKTLNKFNKNKKEQVVYISSLITTNPNKPNLISNKKTFLKNWLSSKQEKIDLTKILSDVIKTQFSKNEFYSINIKCYFPIKYDYLDQNESYWKSPEKKHYDQKEYLNLEFNSSYNCFFNLINYSNLHKDSINWTEEILNSTLASELYSLLLKLPTLPSLNSKKNENMESIYSIFKNFNSNLKIDSLNYINNNWAKIYDAKKEDELNNLFKNPYGMNSSFLTIYNMILTECINTNEKFNINNQELIKKSIEKYTENSTDAEEIIKKISYINLMNNVKEKSTENKRLKI